MRSSQVALVEKEGGPRPSMELSRSEKACPVGPGVLGNGLQPGLLSGVSITGAIQGK